MVEVVGGEPGGAGSAVDHAAQLPDREVGRREGTVLEFGRDEFESLGVTGAVDLEFRVAAPDVTVDGLGVHGEIGRASWRARG